MTELADPFGADVGTEFLPSFRFYSQIGRVLDILAQLFQVLRGGLKELFDALPQHVIGLPQGRGAQLSDDGLIKQFLRRRRFGAQENLRIRMGRFERSPALESRLK